MEAINISQEQLNELRPQIPDDKPFDELIQESLQVGNSVERTASVGTDVQCQDFSFDIKILAIKGKFCSDGSLEIALSVAGIQLQKVSLDLSPGGEGYCMNPGLGPLLALKLCFSFKDGCLYTSGSLTGFFKKVATWDTEILCFN